MTLPFRARLSALLLTCAALASSAVAQEGAKPPAGLDDAIQLSAFGERPAVSPDGKRIAFIGKTYGDAYELEVATGRLRNLTANVPHQGILRVQYLSSGDYLLTAPRHYIGAASRTHSELWILDKSLTKGLQPVDQIVIEGVAISRRSNLIAWMEFIEPQQEVKVDRGAPWKFPRGATATYVGELRYAGGKAQIVNKREILRPDPAKCTVAEPQDFTAGDRDLTWSCGLIRDDAGVYAGAMGVDLATGNITAFRAVETEYNEIEGIGPDGSWSMVECGTRAQRGLPPLDLCRINHKAGAPLQRVLVVTQGGGTKKVNNPVVSPDGTWIAFASSDTTFDAGAGDGIYMLRITR